MEGLPRTRGAPAMAKRSWKVEWRAQPKSDGLERLGQAVRLAIDRVVVAPSTQTKKNGEQLRIAVHTSADAFEELDA
jgi:hypothetical protein